MRVYRHYRERSRRAAMVVLGLLAVAALAGLVWSVQGGMRPAPPVPVFLAVLLVACINLWVVGSTAVEVRLEDAGMVEFVAPLRAVRLPAAEIESIKPSEAMRGALFVVRHRQGSVRLDPRLNGMHELIAELRRHNPGIELLGI